MYAPYQQTMGAISSLGQTAERLAALDAVRKNAAAEHELGMAKLGVQKQQTEAQGRLGLINAERAIASEQANAAYRNAMLGETMGRNKFEMERLKESDEQKRWMGETGNFETLYRGSLAKQGMNPRQIDETINKFATSDPYGYSKILLTTPTTREKMYDALNDLPRFITSLAAQQRAERAAGKSASGTPELLSDWEYVNKNLRPIAGELNAPPDSKEGQQFKVLARQNNAIAYAYGEQKYLPDGTPVTDATGKPVIQNKWYVVPVRAAGGVAEGMLYQDLAETHPRLRYLDPMKKNEVLARVIAQPEQQENIMREYGVSLADENPNAVPVQSRTAAPSSGISAVVPPSNTNPMNARTYNPDAVAVRNELLSPIASTARTLGQGFSALYDISRRPVNPATGVPYR